MLSRPDADNAAAEPSIDFSGSSADVQKYMRLGQQAEAKNNTEVALMMYRAAADADKSDPVPLLAVAKLQEAAGDNQAASQLYEAAAQKRPRDTELQLAAARNLLKQRNYKLAAQRYERLAEDSGDWRAYNGLGVARGFLGNDAAARAAYAKALDRTPDAAKGKVRANLALSQILAGDSRATIALLEPRQADGSNSPEETRLLALAYGFCGPGRRCATTRAERAAQPRLVAPNAGTAGRACGQRCATEGCGTGWKRR